MIQKILVVAAVIVCSMLVSFLVVFFVYSLVRDPGGVLRDIFKALHDLG